MINLDDEHTYFVINAVKHSVHPPYVSRRRGPREELRHKGTSVAKTVRDGFEPLLEGELGFRGSQMVAVIGTAGAAVRGRGEPRSHGA